MIVHLYRSTVAICPQLARPGMPVAEVTRSERIETDTIDMILDRRLLTPAGNQRCSSHRPVGLQCLTFGRNGEKSRAFRP